MSSLAIGIFQNEDLKSLNSNFLLDANIWRKKVSQAYRHFKKHDQRQFYDDNGFFVTIDQLKSFQILIITAEDIYALNRLTFSRITKIMRDADHLLNFETFANLDALIASNLQHKEIFENLNKSLHLTNESKESFPNDLSQLTKLVQPKVSESSELLFLFQKLKFDFLKDDPLDDLAFQNVTDKERTMEKIQFDQFLVNINAWNPDTIPSEPIRISFVNDRPQNSLQILMRNSVLTGHENRSKGKLIVDELLSIKVHETEIVDLLIQGRIILANPIKGLAYYVQANNAAWNNPNLVQKTSLIKPEIGLLSESNEGFQFTAEDSKTTPNRALLEYILNPSILTDETIPIYFAYNKTRNMLVLQIKVNPVFGPKISVLKISVICSHNLQENAIRSSQPGIFFENTFVINLEKHLFMMENIPIKMQIHETSANFVKIVASCLINCNMVDFEFIPSSDTGNSLGSVDTRMNIEYTLVL